MGTDCLEPESIKQANFAEAAAMLNAAQFMTNDMSCTGADGQDNVECTIFKGNAGQCKKAVGGIVDCCEKPSGVSLSDYITMIVAVNKLDTAVMAMNPSSAIYGSWNTLRSQSRALGVRSKSLLCLHGTLSWGLGHQRLLARERSKLRLALCRC